MIETIYSNESGESENNAPVSFKMPKNIRQVGKSNAVKKIYVEDYVMTFIKQLAGGEYSGFKLAVLIGQCIRLENIRNIFVSGAVEVKDIDTSGEITFSNDTWSVIYDDIKKYFTEAEIVGWFLGGPGYLLEDKEKIHKIHVDNFAGQDKVLLTYDNLEKEEAFYSFENNRLTKQDGYYIYYEKNEEMQNYMIEHKGVQSIEVDYEDKVSKDIRNILQNKKQPEEENKSITRLMYAAGTLLAVIILVVAATMLNNYDQMSKMQDKIDGLYENMVHIQSLFQDNEVSQTSAGVNDNMVDTSENEGDKSLDIEVVPGDVKPLEGKDSNTEKGEDKRDDEQDDNHEDSSNEELADDAKDTTNATDQEKANTKAASTQNEVKYYIVQAGDTLADISYKLYKTYTKVKKIMELNNIENQDLIYEGQKLIVP